MFNFHSTASLIFGNETSVNSTNQIVDLLGENIFVITDEGLTELGLYDKTIKKLQSYSNINIFNKVESDPSKSTLLKATISLLFISSELYFSSSSLIIL